MLEKAPEKIKPEIRETVEEKSEKEPQPEWEHQVDLWVESKIQRKLDKIVKEKEQEINQTVAKIYKGKDEVKIKSIKQKLIKEEKEKWANRLEAEEAVKEKFKKVFPRLFKDFAVHGHLKINEKGEKIIQPFTDLDGEACLKLAELATGHELKRGSFSKENREDWVKEQVEKELGKIKRKNKDLDQERLKINLTKKYNKIASVQFIDFKDRLPGTTHVDVGQHNGVELLQKTDKAVEDLELTDKEKLEQRLHDKNFWFNLGAIIDHHPEGAPSAANVLFKLINKLGLLDKLKKENPEMQTKIKKMVDFLDIVDSQGFQVIGKPENWNKSDKTILGLHRFLNFQTLWRFFQETDGNFNKELDEKDLKKYGLIFDKKKKGKVETINRQKQQRENIDKSNEKLKELEKNGFVVNTKFGKIVIDVDGKVPGGAWCTKRVDAGYLKWDSKNKTLFLFSDQELDDDLFYPENYDSKNPEHEKFGTRVRKHLWVVPQGLGETNLTLNKVIEKIGGEVEKGSELEKYLIEEKLIDKFKNKGWLTKTEKNKLIAIIENKAQAIQEEIDKLKEEENKK